MWYKGGGGGGEERAVDSERIQSQKERISAV